MKYLIVVIFLMCVSLTAWTHHPTNDGSSDRSRSLNTLRKKVFCEMRNQYALAPAAFGSSNADSDWDKFSELCFGFNIRRSMTVDEMRELIVVVSDEILAIINKDEGIQPYLENPPFERNNLFLSIAPNFNSSVEEYAPNVYGGYVMTDYFRYRMLEPGNPPEKIVIDEPFEEALAKLELSKTKARKTIAP